MRWFKVWFLMVLFLAAAKSYALQWDKHALYFGGSLGYGSTTWWGLVPSDENANDAMIISTPEKVREGGIAGGVFVGYELLPFVALEAAYTRYPNAHIYFNEMSLVTFNYHIRELNTRTEMISLLAKIMFYIPNTALRMFSGFGAGDLHREDALADRWRISPTFSCYASTGLGHHFNP